MARIEKRPERSAALPGGNTEAAAAPAREPREPRGARRKRETRAKLLGAAFELMAERGPAAVAINEITEAADVGFGSFYNHFDSKEAIHDAVVDDVLIRFSETLSHISETLDDPAEILAASFRYVALRARREPLWGRFLVRNAFSLRNIAKGMGNYLLLDLQRGYDAGRFRAEDRMTTLLMVGGALAAAITLELEVASDPKGASRLTKDLNVDVSSLAERAATAVLRLLGLPDAEAHEIANRPLPPLPVKGPAV